MQCDAHGLLHLAFLLLFASDVCSARHRSETAPLIGDCVGLRNAQCLSNGTWSRSGVLKLVLQLKQMVPMLGRPIDLLTIYKSPLVMNVFSREISIGLELRKATLF